MFRNKVLVRVSPPSFSSPFVLIPLSLPVAYGDRSPSSSSFDPIALEILCCKLSRTWRLACFFHSFDIFVVYQESQSESATRVVEEIVRSFPSINVGEKEEVQSASLIAKAVECGLRSIMLDESWRCVGDNSFVQSTFASTEERKHLCAVNVRVHAANYDSFVFLVSPDVFWFKRHKISDLASSQMLEKFENGEVIILNEHGLSASCKVLPSLYEGHVIGLSKLLPSGETFKRYEELLLFKHGMSFQSNYFLQIQFHVNMQWYPSALVLEGSGLAPAPQTIRSSEAMRALEYFVNLVGGWDFFSQGPLKVKEVSSLGTGALLPAWRTAASNLKDVTSVDNIPYRCESISQQNSSLNYLQLALDFRTPKPAFGCIFGEARADVHMDTILPSKSILGSKVRYTHDADVRKLASAAQNICSEGKCAKGSNAIEKKHTLAVDFLNEITAEESEYASESCGYMKEDASVKDAMIKITRKDSVSINPIGLHDSSAEKKLVSAEDCMIGVTAAESDLVSESSVTENTQNSSGDCMREHDNIDEVKSISPQSCQTSQKKEIEAFLDKQCLAESVTVAHQATFAKKTLSIENNKEAASGTCKKMKTKHCADKSDIIAKVMDYHIRGALQSLTVSDLKSFLTTKKAKVGGKKEELIQRIIMLLA